MKKGTITLGQSRTGKTHDARTAFNECSLKVVHYTNTSGYGDGKLFLRVEDLFDYFQEFNGNMKKFKQLAHATHLWIDDFGHEAMNVSSFGNGPFNLFSELIKERYHLSEMYPDKNWETHVNTNLNLKEIEDIYGKFILNRILALCPTNPIIKKEVYSI